MESESWVVEEGLDWMDNPAARIWALLDYDAADKDALVRVKDGAGGRMAKTHGPLRIHPVTDGNDRVQVVVLECAPNPSRAFRSNHQEILTS